MEAKIKKAVQKYGKLHKAGLERAEVEAELMKDEGLTLDEQVEVLNDIYESKQPEQSAPPVPVKESGMAYYEKWRAKPVFKFRINEDTGQRERYLSSVEKEGAAKLSRHFIESRHADNLNEQVENSGFYYFPEN